MACLERPKLSDLGLNHRDATLFIKSQWPVHRAVFLAWRVFLACYVFAWLVPEFIFDVNLGDGFSLAGFFIFLTNWTYTLFAMYAVLSCVGVVYFSFADRRNRRAVPPTNATLLDEDAPRDPDIDDDLSESSLLVTDQAPGSAKTRAALPAYLKPAWLLFSICLSVNPIITVVYWLFLNPPTQSALSLALNVHVHALNTAFIVVDLVFSAIPVRAVHVVYGTAYGALYALFTLVYYLAGGTNPLTGGGTAIYPGLLDWSDAGHTVGIVFLIMLCNCLVFFLGYGVYRLRVWIHRRCVAPTEL